MRECGVGYGLEVLEPPARRVLGLVRAGVVDRDRGAVAGELQQVDVVDGELARHERANVQHAHDLAAHEQRHAEQRLDPLLPQDRVHNVRVVDVVQDDGPSVRRDATGEAPAEWDANTLLDLFLDAAGRARDEISTILVEEQDRARVGVQHLARAIQKRIQQLLELEVAEGCVGQSLEAPKTLRVANQIGQGRGIVLDPARVRLARLGQRAAGALRSAQWPVAEKCM